MMRPLIHSMKTEKKVEDEQSNYDAEANDDDREQKLNRLIYELNQLKHISYSLTLCNAIALCYGLILLLAVSWFLIAFGYHVSILETFHMQQADDIPKSIRDYTDSLLINMKCHKIPRELRFDCHPENGASELECTNRGCCWDTINSRHDMDQIQKVPLNVPYCFYPTDWKLYQYQNFTQSQNDFIGHLAKNDITSFYKNDLPLIKIESVSIDESTLRVKIYDPMNSRYEPFYPHRVDPKPFSKNVSRASYRFEIDKSKPGFRVKRALGNGTVIFDSLQVGGFIFADQFLQMSTLLPSTYIYGLGEHRTNLRLNTNWQIFTIFNKDQPPTENANLYGSHPFYIVFEETGHCHGVLLLNSNAMDIVLQPTPALTYRTIGGIFDFYFFMGPTPADVLKQYSEIIGKPFLPPYWSLGFHLCRFGYGSLNKTIEVWNRTRAADIPFDTQWNDLDYMKNANDFTYDTNKFKNLPEFVEKLHKLGMHYIPLIDPGISASEIKPYEPYDSGLRYDIFIKDNNTGKPFVGKVWNRISTVWPDFTHPNALAYWTAMMSQMHSEIEFDGAWIDMNEPSNFYNGRFNGCTPNALDYPLYVPNVVGSLLATKTLCMNAKHHLGWHYNIHNMYATAEAATTNLVLSSIRNKRPFIVSRGTWIGQGAYSAHWTGDIYSSWHDLKMSIPEVLAYSLFQIPMVGADICGFDGNTTESLCNRWMQLGAFYPFSRNHNSDDTIEQDPVAMGDLVVKSSRKALKIRYRFLPYLYTLFVRAHIYGETVARPMFIEFFDDRNAWDIDTQFLWGSAFLIVPVLNEDETKVVAYLPCGVWYNYYTKEQIVSKGQNFTFNAPLNTIPIVIRGGFILPAQTPARTTTASRLNDFELLIALDEFGSASGELIWDDGEGQDTIDSKKYQWINFILNNQILKMGEVRPDLLGMGLRGKKFNPIEIMGVTKNVSWVKVNGKNVPYEYDKKRSYLKVTMPELDELEFTLIWQ